MGQTRKFNTSFLGGEVSDRFLARVDSALYDRTLRILENFIIHPTGALDFDPGTEFICEAKTNSGPVRLIPFEKSSSEKYVLELTEQACRFYKNKARLLSGGNPYEIPTPWLGTHLGDIQTAQQENKMYLAHLVYQLRRLCCYEELSWTLTDANSDESLAVAHATTPYMTSYSFVSDVFNKRPNPANLPPGDGVTCSFSHDGTYFALGCAVTPFYSIYKRSGESYAKLTNPPETPSNVGGVALSPDGKYLVVGSGAGTPNLYIFKRSGDTFEKLADLADPPPGATQKEAFSADGKYLGIALDNTAPYVVVYKRTGDNFAKLPAFDTPPAGQVYGIALSSDGRYLAMQCIVSPYILIYKRNGDNYLKLPNPPTIPTSSGPDITFSNDDVYLVHLQGATSYLNIYKRNGDIFIRLANPATLPGSVPRGVSFSRTGTYLALSLQASPYLLIYKRDADTFTKLTDPTELPAGIAQRCAFTREGWSGISWGEKYPRTLTFHDQRLVLGRDGVVRGSRVGWPQDFTLNASDNSAGFEYSLAGDILEEIVWMRTKAHNIVVGTSLGEWLLTGGDAPITGANVFADRVSGNGSAEICAVLANASLLYVQKGGQRLLEFMYSQQDGGNISPDRTILADHIGEAGFAELAWQRSPNSMLWTRLGTGQLASLTLDRNNSIVAWGRHPRDGTVKSLAIVSGDASNGEDTIYLCMQRVINGVTKQYIEWMKPQRRPADQKDYHFVDCGKTFDYSATYGNITGAASYPLMDHADCESLTAPHVQDDAVGASVNCTFARSSDLAYQGSYSFKFTKTAGGSYSAALFVDNNLTTDLHGFVPGRKYKLNPAMYVPSAGGPSALSEIKLRLMYYNAGGWTVLEASPGAFNQWQLVPIEVTIPPTATGVYIDLYVETTASAGEFFYLDEARLRSPVMITANAHPFLNDDFVRISGVVGMTQLNGNVYTVKNKTANTFELYLVDGVTFCDGAEFSLYVSGGLAEKAMKVLTGLGHLEAKTVAVYADGVELGQEVVAAGSITIDTPGTKIHVGLPLTGKIWTQRLGHFSPIRIPEADLLLYKSRGGKIGSHAGNLMPIRYTDSGLLTGEQRVRIGGRFDEEGSIMIVQDQPLPLTVLGIIGELTVGE